MQAFIYLTGNLFLACIIGFAFITLMKQYKLPSVCKFFVGFSLHPYLIGIYMLLITIIPSRMPNLIYVIVPYLFALLFLLTNRKKVNELYYQCKDFIEKDKSNYLEFAGVGLVSALSFGVVISRATTVIWFFTILLFASILLFFYLKAINKRKAFIEDEIFLVLLFLSARIGFWNSGFNRIYLSLFLCLEGGLLIFAWMTVDNNKISFMRATFLFVWSSVCFFRLLKIKLLTRVLDALGIHFYPTMRTIVLCVLGLYFLILFIKCRKQLITTLFNDTRFLLTYFSLVVIFLIISFIMMRGINIVKGSDAIQYLSEAYEYTQEMKFGSMNDYHGSASGSLVPNIHNPVWPAYLANGLLYTQKIGYPFDYGARISFQLTFVFMLGAVFALGYLIRGYLTGLLSCVIVFSYTVFSQIVLGSSRDGFRIIPLLLFCIVLIGMPFKKNLKNMWLPTLIGFSIMAGHPINAITAFIIIIAYLLWYFITKKGTLIDLIINLIPFGAGALLGGIQIIRAYMELGSVTDGLTEYRKMLIGTSYYNTYITNFLNSFGEEVMWLKKIARSFFRDHGIVITPAIICTGYTCFRFIKHKKVRSEELFIIIIVVLQLLMITDLFGWSGKTLGEWSYRNSRYLVQMYIFYALTIGFVIDYLTVSHFKNNPSFFKVVGTILLCCYLCIPIKMFGIRFRILPNEQLFPEFKIINETIDELYPDKMLLDNYNMNYYLRNQGLSFWSNPMNSLRHALTNKAFYDEAKNNKISAILITEQFWDIYWKNTEMEKFLSSEYIDREIPVLDGSKKMYTIYLIK